MEKVLNYILAHPDLQIAISQIAALIGVASVFYLGLWCRSKLDNKKTAMTGTQHVAMAVTGFIVLGLPQSHVIFQSIQTVEWELFIMLMALVPIFAAGFTCREQLMKWFSGQTERKSGVATEPA